MEPVIQVRRASECVSLPGPATAKGLIGKQYPASICSGWSKSEFRVANTHSLARRACIVVQSGPLLHPAGKPETRSFRESGLRIAVFRNQSGNFAAGRYNRSRRFSYAKANVSLNEHVEPTGLFRPVVISRVILKHRVHSAFHNFAMTFCPSRF